MISPLAQLADSKLIASEVEGEPISNKIRPALNTTSHTIYCILFVREEGLTYGMIR
jgi:hypothetical protein